MPEIDFRLMKLFISQRLDATGLYYYNARYYDPTIGRFISPDSIIPNPANPQSFNRYSYCLNNPLKYIDPSGGPYEEIMVAASKHEKGFDVEKVEAELLYLMEIKTLSLMTVTAF